MQTKEQMISNYNKFMKSCLDAGFTAKQADWLWSHLSSFSDNLCVDEEINE